MKFYTPEEVARLQAEAELEARGRCEREKDMLIQEMRSYRCSACGGLCHEADYFHERCANKLIEGHSVECVGRSLYKGHICECPINHG